MEPMLPPVADGYDVAIKILTITKLLIQVALWGILLGGTIWLLTHNPIPLLIQTIQEQMMKSMANFGQ